MDGAYFVFGKKWDRQRDMGKMKESFKNITHFYFRISIKCA